MFKLLLLLVLKICLGEHCKPNYPAFGPTVSQLTQPINHGEGPTWDERTQLLYYVDLFKGKVYSYNPATGKTFFICFNGNVTAIVQHKTNVNMFYVSVNKSILKINWDGHHKMRIVQNLTTITENFPRGRFNDGKADKQGRLWFGTMGPVVNGHVEPNAGSLYVITKTNVAKPPAIISPISISNGLAWNKDNNKFFFIDSSTYNVVQYDYNDESATISNYTRLINMKDLLGCDALPDGMTIDVNDNLWVALFGSGAVAHINSTDGTIIKLIAIPAQYVTSCIWGGRNLDVLFVTTSQFELNHQQRLQQPAAGSLFAISGLHTRGLPVFGGDI